jgi:hypothetical protein
VRPNTYQGTNSSSLLDDIGFIESLQGIIVSIAFLEEGGRQQLWGAVGTLKTREKVLRKLPDLTKQK